MLKLASLVRYCEQCGHETGDLTPAMHCGQKMLLVEGVVVQIECSNCGARANEPCAHDGGCIDADRG